MKKHLSLSLIIFAFAANSYAQGAWVQKANFGGAARAAASGFSIGTNGYIGLGMDATWTNYFTDFGEWDENTNSWSQKASYPGSPREYLSAFSIGTKGYLGTGSDGIAINTQFWQFTPNCNINLNVSTTNSGCGLATGTASVVATGGTAPYTTQWTNGDKTPLADSLAAGLYMVYVTDASGCTAQAPAIINDASSPTITVTSTTSVTCNGGNNGAISISVSGGTQPYTYLWGNGNTTTAIGNVQAGPHQIQVTDAAGCVSTKIVVVNEPAKITLSDSIQNASCGNPDGSATVFVSGGVTPYTYLWNTTPPQTTQTATGLAAGGYSGIVTDANGCTKSGMVTIQNFGAPTVTLDSIHLVDCATGLGDIYITASGGAGPPYTYLWSTGTTTQNLIGVPAGNYGLSVKGGSNPCTAGFSGVLGKKPPYSPVICIVTVDISTGKNQCVFVKDSIGNASVKQYNFYRETTTAGVYQKLGSKAANLQNIWTDNSANPLQRAWRYKISAEDSCGNEAPISVMHKTIHLAANVGLNNNVNLIWDDYKGFSYGTFIIYRYDPVSGWDSLDAVPSNLHSYTDLTPPVPLQNVHYFVEVRHPSGGCDVQIKNPTPEASNLNSSKSNLQKINPDTTTTSVFDAFASEISIYPNPSTGKFIIVTPTLKGAKAMIEVYSLLGEKIYELISVFPPLEPVLSVSLPLGTGSGIYLLKLKTANGTVTKKVVINK